MPSTTLFDEHVKLGASFTDFGGWQMPVRYTSDLAEHQAVRESVGVFDISHMAEFFVSGEQAAAFLNFALVGRASEITNLRAKYSLLCNEAGGVIDDLIVYRESEHDFLIIANAGNRSAVAEALAKRAHGFSVSVADRSDELSLIAVQGPKSIALLTDLVDIDLSTLPYYSIANGHLAGHPTDFCRTGYTGEDGFELLIPNESAVEVFNLLISKGATVCGLACRDTLRIEAGMPLFGHELDEQTNPFEAGMQRVVRLDREEDFVGKASLQKLVTAKSLVGLVGEGKRAARAEYEIYAGEQLVGHITSGVLSPTLGYPIAMGYVSPEFSGEGTKLEVDVRGTRLPMKVVKLPFYKRGK
ncbi:MAG: glycine cleavage system aminomethyltransferase GcvT [Micrococcales bacterium]